MENVSVNITEIVEVVNIDVTEGLRGEKGEQGIQGIKGDTGEQGIQGIQGIQGEKGEDGNTILNNSLEIKESELFVDGKKLAFEEDVIKKSSLTTYFADNAAAITGGLVVGDMYVTPTGENRTVV